MNNTLNAPDWTNGIIYAASSLTADEIAIRNKFVDEYLKDYDPFAAALRCGFCSELATTYAKDFMNDNYVTWRISKLTFDKPITQDDDDELDVLERKVLEGFKREAFNTGAGSSQVARVAALKALHEFVAKRKELKNAAAGVVAGVMVVPGQQTPDAWEANALQSQQTLKDETMQDVISNDENE